MARKDDRSGRGGNSSNYSSRGQIGRTPQERARDMGGRAGSGYQIGRTPEDRARAMSGEDSESRRTESRRAAASRSRSRRYAESDHRSRYDSYDDYDDYDDYEDYDDYDRHDNYRTSGRRYRDDYDDYEETPAERRRRRQERERQKRIRATGAILAIIFLILVFVAVVVISVVTITSIRRRKAQKEASEALASEMAAEAAETETEESEIVVPETKMNLMMVGDVLLHDKVEQYSKQEDGTYDYSVIFENIANDIATADLALVNEETIIGGEELGVSGYPYFNAPYSLADNLADLGFDVVLGANNHCLDKGEQGILNTLDYFGTNYPSMEVLGIHDSQEDADTIYVYEKNGLKIAILNYTFATNGIDPPETYEVDMLTESKVRSDIEEADELSDFVIVCPHWGTEFELGKTQEQEYWCNIFLEEGVDLVLGTHPHVIEPVEMLTNEETGDQMLVYYSLGNFVSWTSSTGDGVANRSVGGMAQVTIGYQDDGTVGILDYDVEALVCHVTEAVNGVTVYPLSAYTEALAEENAIALQDPNFTYQYCVDLCDQVWGSDWK